MKKILAAVLLAVGLAASSHAFTAINYIPSSTGTVQPGLLYVSSGTIQNANLGGPGFTVVVSTAMSMSSQRITNLANGSAAADAVAFGQIFSGFQAPVLSSTTAATSTTSNVYAATTLTASITPTSASHRIRVTALGTLKTSNGTNSSAFLTIERNTTNLATATGFAILTLPSTQMEVPVTMSFIDSPATTSATSYTVYIKNSDNTTTVYFNFSTVTCTMILDEVI